MQVSGKKLDKDTEQEVFNKLYQVLSDLRKPSNVKEFLEDVLTPVERMVIAKRLAIVLYLEKGKSYDDIKKELKVSSATIASLQKSIEIGGGDGFLLALRRIEADEWASQLTTKVTSFLKSLTIPS